MSIQTCPTDVVAASPERIWGLLIDAEKLAQWIGAKLVDGPGRALVVGDRVVLCPGFGMKVVLDVRAMESPRQLKVDAHLPFGLINHEVIQVMPAGERCRVTFN